MRSKPAALFLAAALIAGAAMPATAADIATGSTLFHQRCMMCHVIGPDEAPTMAPNLFGVVGRPAASTQFAYSSALKASKIVWTKEVLDQFLKAPGKMVPGTRMVFNIPDDTMRANVVAYLATLKKKK